MRDDVTQILGAIDAGDPNAADDLLPLVYDELRALADARIAQERPGQTLQPTALVHEAYLRLLGPEHTQGDWHGREHFFGAAAEAMRRILIDRARARGASKRGGSWKRLPTDLSQIAVDDVPGPLIDLDGALTRFAAEEPDKARLVELRFFGGLTMEQAAGILGISTATATRHWAYARAWLHDDLERNAGHPDPG